MKKVFISPSATYKNQFSNPYFKRLFDGLSPFCEVLDTADYRPRRAQSLTLFLYSFKGDVFLLSFVEGVAFHKFPLIQTFFALMALRIIRLRRRTIVFFYHNTVAHRGDNWMCRMLFRKLFSHADYVVAHSENTALIAADKVGKDRVILFPHPTEPLSIAAPAEEKADVFIWGTILPYKGIYEFLSSPIVQNSDLRIIVIGSCPDPILAQKVHSQTNEHIHFEQRHIEEVELAARISASRFVLFPYFAKSISGSAALMDTLKFGGNVVGPDAGAFHDLSKENLCKVFHDMADLMDILTSKWRVDQEELGHYLNGHVWPEYIRTLRERIPELDDHSA